MQPAKIILEKQTYSVPSAELEREYRTIEELDNLLEEARKDYGVKQKEFKLRWKLCSEKNDSLQKFISEFDNYFKVQTRLTIQANVKLKIWLHSIKLFNFFGAITTRPQN